MQERYMNGDLFGMNSCQEYLAIGKYGTKIYLIWSIIWIWVVDEFGWAINVPFLFQLHKYASACYMWQPFRFSDLEVTR